MSEMQANQYFISGRYSEALSEYEKLPIIKHNKNILGKMIISAALNNNFISALDLLSEMARKKEKQQSESTIDDFECPCEDLVYKLERDSIKENELTEEIKMKIAILSFFINREKSMEYFNQLKVSEYASTVNAFMKSLNNITN